MRLTTQFICILMTLAMAVTTAKGDGTPLRFKEGHFTIAQFTDLHWTTGSANCAKTEQAIRSVVTQEQPQLIVLTGDIVTEKPADKGWREIIAMMDSFRIPFMVTLGNHDPEVIDGAEIFRLLEGSPYFVGEDYERNLSGYGNIALPIAGTKSDAAAVLYFIDSHSSAKDPMLGKYEKIQWDQIAWYRATSQEYAEKYNNQQPIPSLAFFHIPLQEFSLIKGDVKTYGNWHEGTASPGVNSGLFSSFLDMGDVMGAFVGHDHINDYIGIRMGIALAYGRNSGYDAYGDAVRGGRLIKLYEGKRQFDSWITTQEGREPGYYYPSGFNGADEQRMTYLPAKAVTPTQQGVSYTYYEGAFKKVADITPDKAVKEGVMPNFSIDGATVKDHFAYQFKAYINIPERGVYRFYTYTDDGSVLYIDDQLIVDNDGGHSARKREGLVALEAGMHELTLLYFEDYMGETLEVGIVGKNLPEQLIPAEYLYVR